MTVESNSEQAINCFRKGNQFTKEGKPNEAVACYQQAIELAPTQSRFYRRLGEVQISLGQISKAIDCYRSAISTGETSYGNYNQLAYLLQINNELEEAAVHLLQAVQIDPNHYLAYARLRRVKWPNTQATLIEERLQQIIQEQPNNIFPYLTLGDVLLAQNQLDKAITYLQDASNRYAASSNPRFLPSELASNQRKTPDFFLIGAAKSGTTSLYEYLIQHPQVLPALTKEIAFFDVPRRYANGIHWYLAHFPEISEEQEFVTGEATPSYLNRYQVPEKMFQSFPGAKLILVLRNPIERTVSQYHHSVKDNGETRSLEEVIDFEMEMIAELEDPSDVMKTSFKHEPRYAIWSIYYYFLKKWMSVFPKEQFLVINSDDFYTRTSEVMAQVHQFLELSDYQLPDYQKYTVGNYTPISEELRSRLSDLFRPHNQRLESFLGAELNWD